MCGCGTLEDLPSSLTRSAQTLVSQNHNAQESKSSNHEARVVAGAPP